MFSLKSIVDRMERDFYAQVVVDAPPDKVFSYLSDFDHHHEWLAVPAETEKTSEGPVGVGSTFRRINRRRILPYQYDVVVTDYAPDERLAFEGPGRTSINLEPEPAGDGTRLTVRPFLALPAVYPWWWSLVILVCLPAMPVEHHLFRRRIQRMASRVKEYYESPAG